MQINISCEDIDNIIKNLTCMIDILKKYSTTENLQNETANIDKKQNTKTSMFEDAKCKRIFYEIVKKILINTTQKKGTITYGIYQIIYEKIELSDVFEIIDVNTNQIIGEYRRNKNKLYLY